MTLWMNEWDVTYMLDLSERVAGPDSEWARGAVALRRFVNWVDDNSDGWPYWTPPQKAAGRLMHALQGAENKYREGYPASEVMVTGEVARSLTPIKSFLTKRGADWREVIGR